MTTKVLIGGVAGLVIVAGAIAGYVRSAPSSPYDGYRDWKRVTPTPVSLKRSLDMMCMIPPKYLTSDKNPHVPKAFLVYVNEQGKKAMQSKDKADFPIGSVIVKEKFRADRSLDMKKLPEPELLTVMEKKASGWALFGCREREG